MQAWVAIDHIAHNALIDARRRCRPAQSLDQVPEVEPQDHAAAARLVDWMDAELLAAAIRQLTPEQQQVIVLRFVEGLDGASIAILMGRSQRRHHPRAAKLASSARATGRARTGVTGCAATSGGSVAGPLRNRLCREPNRGLLLFFASQVGREARPGDSHKQREQHPATQNEQCYLHPKQCLLHCSFYRSIPAGKEHESWSGRTQVPTRGAGAREMLGEDEAALPITSCRAGGLAFRSNRIERDTR